MMQRIQAVLVCVLPVLERRQLPLGGAAGSLESRTKGCKGGVSESGLQILSPVSEVEAGGKFSAGCAVPSETGCRLNASRSTRHEVPRWSVEDVRSQVRSFVCQAETSRMWATGTVGDMGAKG